MSKETNSNGALTAGIVLLAISCVLIGYGLAKLVNDLGGAAVPLGVGSSFAGLATIFIVRASSAKTDQTKGE